MNEKIVLINDDCLKYLKTLPDNSVDLIITDPPYFISGLDNSWKSKKITERNTKDSPHKHLPVGMKFSKSQSLNLFSFYHEVSLIALSKLKPGGYFLSFSSPRLIHAIAMACDEAGFEIRDQINWIYPVTIPKGMGVTHIINKMNDINLEEKEKLIKQYQGFKTPQLKSNFEPICVAMKPINTTFIRNEIEWNTGLINFNEKVGLNSDKVPSNIISTEIFPDCDIYNNNFLINKPSIKERGGKENTHITVKPVKLMKHLIKIFSKENSLIVDPFMGSGTTGIACVELKRKFIGIELNEEYYLISKKRIENAKIS